MKQKDKWSKCAWLITVLVTVAIAAALIITRNTPWLFYMLVGVTATVFISMWIWSSTLIIVDDEFITMHKQIGRKRTPIYNIQSSTRFTPQAEICYPLCGSGDFAGYYGWFHNPRIGNYFGYYVNMQECFLVRLNDGKQYVIGCENSEGVINHITSNLKNKLDEIYSNDTDHYGIFNTAGKIVR